MYRRLTTSELIIRLVFDDFCLFLNTFILLETICHHSWIWTGIIVPITAVCLYTAIVDSYHWKDSKR